MMPMAIPGMTLGLAYIFFFNNPVNPLNFIYGSMAILVICTIIHFYTVSHLTAVTALKQIDTSEYNPLEFVKTNVLGSSTWAEIYGVKHIGSIKALTTALMVFATAFGTALFGILIDINFSIEQIAIVSGTYILTSIILLYSVRTKLNPQYI